MRQYTCIRAFLSRSSGTALCPELYARRNKMSIMFLSCGTKFCVSQFFAYFGTLFYVLFQIFMRFVYNQPQKCVKKAAAQTLCSGFCFYPNRVQKASRTAVSRPRGMGMRAPLRIRTSPGESSCTASRLTT
mgnify:CR=1 FL=1